MDGMWDRGYYVEELKNVREGGGMKLGYKVEVDEGWIIGKYGVRGV